jgi:hypothetical protein
MDSEQKGRSALLENLLPFFKGIHITTNLVETTFSACKVLLGFRGRRSVERWKEYTKAFFVVWFCPEVLPNVLDGLSLSSKSVLRVLSRFGFSLKDTI